MEAAPRLDRRSDDDEFRPALGRDVRDLLAEAPGARADDLLPDRDTVRARDRGRRREPLLQASESAVHVRIERQLALDHQRRDEDDARPAVCSQPASEIESVIRLLPIEQRHDDAPVGDGARPACQASGAVVQGTNVWKLHFRSWYGTDARITFGSKSRSRLR